MKRIAIVGTGPTGIYTFKSLRNASFTGHVTLVEKRDQIGIGLPYSPETATKSMLANIASIEIPPVVGTYLDWLTQQPASVLKSYGLDPNDLDERQFTPRLLLGQYFRDQMVDLIDDGIPSTRTTADVRSATEVSDIVPCDDGLLLSIPNGTDLGPFDHVVVATGHVFPDASEATPNFFPSPWSGLIQSEIPAVRVGIMGTSLSSIDAAMAVATQHGRFRRTAGELGFEVDDSNLKITLMSWTGVLPEADFYCPLPYQPLEIMTEEAVAACASQDRPLDAVFDVIRLQLTLSDPDYARRIGLPDLTVDSFAGAYFAERERQDPFRWARKNLEEVERNKKSKTTVPWRYALLRMHAKLEAIVPSLTEPDRERFDVLKTVFVDNYAAVPSESIRRLLALRDAGTLSVLALGNDYKLERDGEKTLIRHHGKVSTFDVFIDARGQQPMTTADMPFPTLRAALTEAGQETPEVDETFGLSGVEGYSGRLTLAAIPYLMHYRPFVQGITASAEIGETIAAKLTTD